MMIAGDKTAIKTHRIKHHDICRYSRTERKNVPDPNKQTEDAIRSYLL